MLGSFGGPVGAAIGAVFGAIIGGVIPGVIAGGIQAHTLWENQPGIMRSTTLIPTPVGLDRSQTVRFGQPVVTGVNLFGFQSRLQPRICVAEGFMCGFDLQMPSRPFPGTDLAACPLKSSVPSAFSEYLKTEDAEKRTLLFQLGCLVERPGESRGWLVWKFEHGTMVMAAGDPAGSERLAVLWIQDDSKGRLLRLAWQMPGRPHNWFNVNAYVTSVGTGPGNPPGGDVDYKHSGDPDNTDKSDRGEVAFDLAGVRDTAWSVLMSACDPTYGFLGIRTGHKCPANIFPCFDVDVSIPPKQPFSCAAHTSRTGDLILEVGSSCSNSPYGLFVYIWSNPCSDRCPDGANNYGFVVAAPSRGWTSWTDFSDMVYASTVAYRSTSGHDYLPMDIPSTVAVPIGPPVRLRSATPKPIWDPIGPPSFHTVTFRWQGRAEADTHVLDDTGAPGTFGILSKTYVDWPTALGHITAPDVTGAGTEFVRSSGAGCFTVAGLPTVSDPDPPGLLVDMRNVAAPVTTEMRTSNLAAACP